MDDSRSYSVYMHTAPNGKVYVGVTCQKPERRWGRDGCHYRQNRHLSNAIEKYGWSNIRHEVILTNVTAESAYAAEIELIALYRSNENAFGYNNSTGGECARIGAKASEETRALLSYLNSGPRSNFYGKPGTMLGKKHSAETRQKNEFDSSWCKAFLRMESENSGCSEGQTNGR